MGRTRGAGPAAANAAGRTAAPPHQRGVLVIDETGDRKAGNQMAHGGRQYLANLGKIDNGVVSVTSLWADARVYYPIDLDPYTLAHHFTHGKADPPFRTKLPLAVELVRRAVQVSLRRGVEQSYKPVKQALG